MAEQKTRITVYLTEEFRKPFYEALAKRQIALGKSGAKLTPAVFARELIFQALGDDHASAAVEPSQDEVRQLRVELARVVATLMASETRTGSNPDPGLRSKIADWVKRYLAEEDREAWIDRLSRTGSPDKT